ncbi:hypothetical protein M045_gp73 [Mycobacterium phage HINdeR]|uniref:Uncharacterized protein n=1 Tax=Mycobacterium phage HINdeR TaxID=1327770 RepID=R4JHT1_9CAUD|nr:hypothetical protein M045_gp73 [Mycobacterium phage HINdeR]AGK87552.1 hypothetical protein PBI_HINDER_73 [Mycobacterium phage HINdeR]
MATKLMSEPTGLMKTAEQQERWIELLERRLDVAKAKLAEITSGPAEPVEDFTVVRFRKYNQMYTFAAMKVGRRWFLTQDGSRTSKQGKAPMVWSDLLDFIGERNWDTIEVLS